MCVCIIYIYNRQPFVDSNLTFFACKTDTLIFSQHSNSDMGGAVVQYALLFVLNGDSLVSLIIYIFVII